MDYLLGVDLIDDYADDSDIDSQENNINLKRRKINIAISLNSLLNLEGSNYFRYPIVRKGNFHRDRDAIMRWVTILDDNMFRRQFRLEREDFNMVLGKINDDLKPHAQQAVNSSGSPISPIEYCAL